MAIISYAQNLEDVILQRVLSHVETGFYVDVGASLPHQDSVTYALYQKGWRGICVEPLGYEQLWHEFRPQDILIKAALGEKPGQTTFHIFDKAQQVSTGSLETLAHWKKHGLLPNRTVTVPVRTLNDVLAQYLGVRDLHLVSLDVEGMEREVLLGLDLQRYRPWIIIIEATVPGTRNPSFDKWETIVLKARYEAVYFDGINRFYLSEEQRGLQAHFRLPPNIWDDYVLAAQVTQQKKIAELEQQVEKLTVELKARSAGPQC